MTLSAQPHGDPVRSKGVWIWAPLIILGVLLSAESAVLGIAGVSNMWTLLTSLVAAVIALGGTLREQRLALTRAPRQHRFWVGVFMLIALAAPAVSALAAPSEAVATKNIVGLSGGCTSYFVYGQNRWAPYGAAIRAAPNREARQLGAVAGNKLVYVNGWVQTESAQPSNYPPWNSNIWFHLSDNSGWISYPGTRAIPTPQDPSGQDSNGGTPAPTPAACEGATR